MGVNSGVQWDNTLLSAIAGSYVVIIYVVIFHFWGIFWCRRPAGTDVR
jgi:hypothetical protein